MVGQVKFTYTAYYHTQRSFKFYYRNTTHVKNIKVSKNQYNRKEGKGFNESI